jgi:ABC-type polysaccharide/polyol phosphate export permease
LINIFKTFYKYRGLVEQLVKRDLKVKYRRSVLGYLWSLLNPLIMMMVISAVFSTVFRFDIPNFPIYMLSGMIIFNFFSEATTSAMSSIVNGGALIKKVYLPKYIFPFSRTLSSFVNLLFSLLAIVIMLFITKVPVTPILLLFPLPLLYVLLFSIGVGLILSVCMVYFRDTAHLYGVFLTAWMYFTPIFYPESIVPAFTRNLLKFNPLYHFIQIFRQVVLYGQMPTMKENLICVGVCVVSIFVGLLFFRKNQDKFILYI